MRRISPRISCTVLRVFWGKPHTDILEDIGTYLVAHPNLEAVRRLMWFGGTDFQDFLQSLDDLPGRVRMAVPDLNMPKIDLIEHSHDLVEVVISDQPESLTGYGYVILGLLRAMADDYGALVFMDHKEGDNGTETIDVRLLEAAFAEGRAFSLGAGQTEAGHP